MITICNESKIYVLCAAGFQTGGTELAHQLVDYLINNSFDAYIVYIDFPEKKYSVNSEIPEGFRKYRIQVASNVIDDKHNILVLPETYFSWSDRFDKLQFLFWWMSVDNYYTTTTILETYYLKNSFYFLIKQIYFRLKSRKKLFNGNTLDKLRKKEACSVHGYQSVYAQNHLLKRGICNVLPLGDYINTNFKKSKIDDVPKENIILYNPAKGIKFTKKIISVLPDVTFVPLVNLSREQLKELFIRAKLYIDFGNHPGKDRLPREAALHDCCIITGKKGSAFYFEDVPILSDYKFDETQLPEIKKIIKDILDNYSHHIMNFDFYKRRIVLEEQKFQENICEIFYQNKEI